VRSRDMQAWNPNKVRDIVLNRVIKYMEYRGSELFWIDQECIDQDDNKGKDVAMQSMGSVYSLSNLPVGLLSVPIESEEHLDLLTELLDGDLVKDNGEQKRQLLVTRARAWIALEFLNQLTSDKWWSRAWIFQEDYLSQTKMMLLIPHSPILEYRKRARYDLFNKLPSELCVNSATFRTKATEFCLAYKKMEWNNPRRYSDICNKILQKGGKYTILLREPAENKEDMICKSMSPSIFTDIGKRGITDHWDLLAIAANCCGYSNYLITTRLKAMKCSLSLSILTLYLLNGEIIWNNTTSGIDALRDNIFDFLKEQSLNNFNLPIAKRELTFIKRCRFPDVKLLENGIKTTGQLWKLGKVIDTRKFSHNLPWEEPSADGLGLYRRRLKQLASELASGKHGRKYKTLARGIVDYLKQDAGLEDDIVVKAGDKCFAKEYEDLMVETLVQAIEEGKNLRLAHRANITTKKQAKRTYTPYRGIFVTDSYEMFERKWQSYVFTASDYSGYIEKHVSLDVNWDGTISKGLPRIITKGWINGLCFGKYPLVNVVFPWPASLLS
jgi:hypothetical protein